MNLIDISFDVFTDTPKGKDADSHSPTLRKYHKLLWSKRLPNGVKFDLDYISSSSGSLWLHHKSKLGEYFLSSDGIGHTYRDWKRMSHVVENIPDDEINSFYSVCSTIGAFIIFPANKIDNKMTINGSRGTKSEIRDRFDLTLECIRRFYFKETSPLSDTLERYSQFFSLFQDFKGYVDFFLLQDLIEKNYLAVKFCLPFNGFDYSPLPKNIEEYQAYKKI